MEKSNKNEKQKNLKKKKGRIQMPETAQHTTSIPGLNQDQ